MANWGDISEIFNSNNVLFKMGTTPDTPDTVEEIILIHSFRMPKDMPIARTISRNGPVETPNPILREFLINADITKDLFNKLEALSEPTTRGGFFIEDFQLLAESILDPGAQENDITLNFDGYVRHIDGIAIEDQKFNVDFIIRALNNTVVIT